MIEARRETHPRDLAQLKALAITTSRAARYALLDGRSAVQLSLCESESDRVDQETPGRRGLLQNETDCLRGGAEIARNEIMDSR
jgi:hypothetical protein